MTPRITLATAARILRQLRGDHRTVALMLLVPCVLLGLLAWVYVDCPATCSTRSAPPLLGVFPFVVMFIVTSVATLRERTSGTLERLLTTPLGKGDLMLGYALAFGTMAVLQALRRRRPSRSGCCGLDIAGPAWAARRRRPPRRAARHGARPARERVRPHRVPGGAVHARLRPPTVPALRAAPAPRRDARPARVALRRPAALVRRRRDAGVTTNADPLADILPSLGVIVLVDRLRARARQPDPPPPHTVTLRLAC